VDYKTTVDIPQGDRGVIHPGHPPVIEAVLIAAGRQYRSGTLFKSGASGAVPPADEVTSGTPAPAEQAELVLVEDIDTTGGAKLGLCLRHGMAVRARLINAAGGTDVTASDALVKTLPVRGIYPVQGFDTTKMA
jgi:hypothetical protein